MTDCRNSKMHNSDCDPYLSLSQVYQVNNQPLQCYTDGASRGNPGPSAYACILVGSNGEILSEHGGYLGWGTNNSAEYHAIIYALKEAARFTKGRVAVFSDSELVVRQINGIYRIRKEHLSRLFKQVSTCVRVFEDVEFVHVVREHPFIQRADALCNHILDQQM